MVKRTPEQYFDISVADNARANISEVPAHVVEVLNRLSAIGTELVDQMNRWYPSEQPTPVRLQFGSEEAVEWPP
jgi:hypothetical protein